MPKVVNSWNEWDPLKRVIVGRPEGTNIPAPEPAWWYDRPEGGYPLGASVIQSSERIPGRNQVADHPPPGPSAGAPRHAHGCHTGTGAGGR